MTDVPIFIHILGVATPLAITATFYNGNLFSAHVFLMSVTYLLVIPEGMIMAVKAVRHKNRPQMMRFHMYIQTASVIMAILGLAAQFWHRYKQGKAHFKGLHSLLGVATILITELLALGGVVLMFFIPKAKRLDMPKVVAIHKLGGRFVFLLGVATTLEALKIFDRGHKRNKGAITYILACMIAAQAVGLYTVIWPQSGAGPVHRKTGSSSSGGLSQSRDVPLSVAGKFSAEYEKVEQGEVEVRSEKETD